MLVFYIPVESENYSHRVQLARTAICVSYWISVEQEPENSAPNSVFSVWFLDGIVTPRIWNGSHSYKKKPAASFVLSQATFLFAFRGNPAVCSSVFDCIPNQSEVDCLFLGNLIVPKPFDSIS